MARKKVEEPHVEQPTEAQQRVYKSMVDDTPTEVGILRTEKKYLIHWLKNGTIAKLSRLLIHKGETDNEDENADNNVMSVIIEDSKLASKAAAAIILNGYWRIKFKYWFLWRWFYYVRQYDSLQLQPIIAEGKKKVPLIQFYGTTTLLTGVKDTLMQMRTKEVERTLQEQALAQLSGSQSTGNGLSQPDTSASAS